MCQVTCIRIFLCVIAIGIFPSAVANDEIAAICEQKLCRGERVIQVQLDQERYFEIDVEGTVIAHETNISIYPGEAFSITAQVEDSEIVDLAPSGDSSSSVPAIRVRLDQEVEDDGSISTMLVVQNQLDRTLRYEAYMDIDGTNQYLYTSSCPVRSQLSSFEHWPHAIVHFVMTNVRFLSEEDGDSMACE